MRSLHHVPDPRSAFPELRRVVREYVWIAEPLPEGDFFELLRPVDDETEVRAEAQRAIAEQDGFDRVETIEYDVTLPVPTFEALRDRVLAADPTRAERFAAARGRPARQVHARRLRRADARGPAAAYQPVNTSSPLRSSSRASIVPSASSVAIASCSPASSRSTIRCSPRPGSRVWAA